MQTQAYPLSWPEGWPRTPTYQRRAAQFNTSRNGGGKKRLSIDRALLRESGIAGAFVEKWALQPQRPDNAHASGDQRGD